MSLSTFTTISTEDKFLASFWVEENQEAYRPVPAVEWTRAWTIRTRPNLWLAVNKPKAQDSNLNKPYFEKNLEVGFSLESSNITSLKPRVKSSSRVIFTRLGSSGSTLKAWARFGLKNGLVLPLPETQLIMNSLWKVQGRNDLHHRSLWYIRLRPPMSNVYKPSWSFSLALFHFSLVPVNVCE